MFKIKGKIGEFLVRKKQSAFPKDMDIHFREIYEKSKDYSMVSMDGLYSIFEAIKYVSNAKIQGDVVECGVWRGGSMMVAAFTLNYLKEKERFIYLYDTFEGMPEPGEVDRKLRTNEFAKQTWIEKQGQGGWAKSSLEEVKKNLYSIEEFPKEKLIFVEGKVEDTIPQIVPEKISVLRLDTDWYSSTYHELKHLYPLLSVGGVVIIDDYGSWSGSRDATDKYFEENNINLYLHRIGTTRIGVKTK